MVDKGPDHPDHTDRLSDEDAAASTVVKDSEALQSRILGRMQVGCLEFAEHVAFFKSNPTSDARHLLVDDLQTLRNSSVLLEKSALTLFIEELLAPLSSDPPLQDVKGRQLAEVLASAADKLKDQLALMLGDSSLDNGLSLLPLINDVRSIRDESLLSDSVMLVLGLEHAAFVVDRATPQQWEQQHELWVTYASEHHSSLMRRLLYWWNDAGPDSSRPLIRQLGRFADMTSQQGYLLPLTILFQSASLIARACGDNELEQGPAIRGLFVQIERCVHAFANHKTQSDLVPADLLRNCLYYVSQTTDEGATAVSLRRRFRLDCVRRSRSSAALSTSVIGADYHLLNAMREYISRESAVLRVERPEHDADKKNVLLVKAQLWRLRFRLRQSGAMLALMGSSPALLTLEYINKELSSVDFSGGMVEISFLESILPAFSRLDRELDTLARGSVIGVKKAQATATYERDTYLDIASDVCLREARIELQKIWQKIVPVLQCGTTDDEFAHQLSVKLLQADNALQILPLPEVSPLIRTLAGVIEQVCCEFYGCDSDAGKEQLADHKEQAESSVSELLFAVFVSLGEYLSCVFQPLPVASQYLNNAENSLEQLLDTLEKTPAGQPDRTIAGQLTGDVSLTDAVDLLLDVDDEISLDSLLDKKQYFLDARPQTGFGEESITYIENLELAVQQALTPSVSGDAQLPNEAMLRSLHGLTSISQTMGSEQVASIVQPLQKVSLSLHRQGKFLNAEQTRFVGELADGLRSWMQAEPGESHEFATTIPVKNVKERLQEFLTALMSVDEPSTRSPLQAGNGARNTQSMNLTRGPDELFNIEASDSLENLRVIISHKNFNDVSVQASLSILHTLKGSARMLGKLPISECAHELEAELQSHIPLDEQLRILKSGYRSLQSHMLNLTTAKRSDQMKLYRAQTTPSLLWEMDGSTSDRDVQADDILLDMATEMAVHQARLSDEFAKVRTAFEDFEITARRWRDARGFIGSAGSSESSEILADVSATQTNLRNAIYAAERQQQSASRESARLQQAVVRSRLVRFDAIKDRLNDTISEIALLCGVSVRLDVVGGELMIDRTLFKQLHAPLEHLIRNAIVHGIERPEERLTKSKPGTGCISVSVSVDGTAVVIDVKDDGRGLDIQRLERFISEQSEKSHNPGTLGKDRLQEILFRSGFSTVSRPDALAGHGLGLSAVAAAMDRLKGRVELSEPELQGFGVELRVPQRIVVTPALIVESDNQLYAMSLAFVKSVMLDSSGAVAISDVVASSSLSLRQLLGYTHSDHGALPDTAVHRPTVTVQVSTHSRVIEVDRVIGYRELVMQPLGPQMESLQQFSAGSVLPDGQHVLILDLPSILRVRRAVSSPQGRSIINVNKSSALVVDDSLTTRSVVQGMLEERGLETRTCKDGVEALQQLMIRLPDFLIVDLEMPRLDGWGLMRRISDEYGESNLGVVVISGRDDNQTRERARKLGAVAFLPKPHTRDQLRAAIEAAGVKLPDLTIA